MRIPRLRAIAVAAAALLCALNPAVRPVEAQSARRVVAVADIHGAYDAFVEILAKANLIDARRQWTGGSATFVQTGDFTDRGADVRKVMDLLIALEGQARTGGGEAITLLGNHEVMNALGTLRDVNAAACQAFVDGDSAARREDAWKQYEALRSARDKVRAPAPPVYEQTREAWLDAHPIGCLEYRAAFGPQGAYGKWLRRKDVVAKVDGTVFMHAGINPAQPMSIDDINDRVRREMERYDGFVAKMVQRKLALPFFSLQEVVQAATSELEAAAIVMEQAKVRGAPPDLGGFDVDLLKEAVEIIKIGDWTVLAPEGPLWYRGFATLGETTGREPVGALLKRLGATRFAVGHSPLKDARMMLRFGGRVVLMDTGMLASVYKGRPSALEIRGGVLTAIYPDQTVPLVAATPY